MHRFALPILALVALALGCAKPVDNPEGPAPGVSTASLTEIPGMARYALAEPIQMNNVSIVPVVSKEQAPIGPDYATLAEARKNGWIEITEQKDGSEVNALDVTNSGPKPILLLSGDLLLGGHQDRVVAKDTIVPPGETVKVPVYCVEQGRWSGPTDKFSYGDTTVPLEVKQEATFGDQEAVWGEVGKFNGMTNVPAGGGTTVNLGLEQEKVQKQITDGLEKVRAQLARNKNIVGVMFVVDGEVHSLELFGNARLFNASRDSLLKGALAQAAVSSTNSPKKVSLKDCAGFMAEAMKSDRVVEMRNEGNVRARRASPASKGVELHFQEGQKATGLVHGSYTKQ